MREAVDAFPKTIDKRGGTILKMRALSEKPARLADVGRRLAISGERARQLEARVLTGLRDVHRSARGRVTDHRLKRSER